MGDLVAKELDVDLTEDEWKERSDMLGHAQLELETARIKSKESASHHSGIVKKVEARIHELARAVRDKKEARTVQCEERANARMFRIETVRLDTGALIDARAMNDEELADAQQGHLFTDKAQKSQKKAKADAAATEPGDSHTLPDHPVIETERTADERIPCPGPEGGKGCEGEACMRCAGLLFIPNPDYSPPTGAAPEPEIEAGTEIAAPDAMLAGAAAAPEPEGGKRSRRGMRAEAH